MDIDAVVKDCQNGSKEAFGVLYQTFSLPMRGVIGYYVRNNDVVQDILHDGFIVAFTSIENLKDVSKIEAWLTTIMKNLALQYLRKEAEHLIIPISDTAIPEQLAEQKTETDLSWEQLESIINRLPDGYGKVFRLNVLQGLSHKEIAKLLGISHLTSASQLHHAKALLRRMIYQYRMEMGIFSVVIAIIFIVYNFISRRNIQEGTILPSNDKILSSNNTIIDFSTEQPDSIKKNRETSLNPSLHNSIPLAEEKEIAKVEIKEDTVYNVQQDSVHSDTIPTMPIMPNNERLITHVDQDIPVKLSNTSDWNFSLAYSGTMGQGNRLKYRVPDFSSGVPDEEMEENKTTKHYMPVTVGFSLSKGISPRWSIESGLRYTYLRTDIFTENKYNRTETFNKIHYIGIPLKFSYKIFRTNKFSIYGQTGFVLDIPVNGRSYSYDYNYNETSPIFSKYRLNMPLQWSIEGGLGIQYQLTPSISIYAEPSFNYYFNSGSEVNTIRQDKPFEFTIPIGIRLTW